MRRRSQRAARVARGRHASAPGAALADAGARRCCRWLNLVCTSFHNVTWAGGQATLDSGRAHALPRAARTTRCCGAGLLQHHRLRGRRGRRARWCSGFALALLCSRVSARPRALSHPLHPADPDSRHRHRRDLEADATTTTSASSTRRSACSGSSRATGWATTSTALALGDRRRHLALDAVLLPAAARRPRIAAAGRLRGGARSTAPRGWQELRYVTLPMMLPTIVVTFAFRLVIAFKVFDEIYLLTGGGPGTATEVRELHDLPALLHRGPRRLRLGDVGRRHLPVLARCWSWRCRRGARRRRPAMTGAGARTLVGRTRVP